MKVYYNFELVPESQLKTGVENRAFQFGDGVFETLVCRNGKVSFLRQHYNRITEGLQALKMELPPKFNFSSLYEGIEQTMYANSLIDDARIKVLVWRKRGGLYTPSESGSDFMITAKPNVPSFENNRNKVVISKTVQVHYTKWSGVKTIGSLPYVMAGLERLERGADEIILLDNNGNLAECGSSNLFWLQEGVLYTPSLKTGCKNGIVRRVLLEGCFSGSENAVEVLTDIEALWEAEAVFAANVTGIYPILKIEDHEYKPEFMQQYGINNLFDNLLAFDSMA